MIPFRTCIIFLLVFSFFASDFISAEVLDSAEGGFSIEITKRIAASPQEVYDALIRDIGRWWDPNHTFSGDSKNLSLDAAPGGCFCEKLSGGSLRHLVVLYADKGKLLRLNGGLGPLQEMAVTGSMTFRFKQEVNSTTLLFHYNVAGYSKGGLQVIARPVDSVLEGQLERLKQFVEAR